MRTTAALPPTEIQARAIGAPPIQVLLLDLAGTLVGRLWLGSDRRIPGDKETRS